METDRPDYEAARAALATLASQLQRMRWPDPRRGPLGEGVSAADAYGRMFAAVAASIDDHERTFDRPGSVTP